MMNRPSEKHRPLGRVATVERNAPRNSMTFFASPIGCAAISYALIIGALLLPPSVYSSLMMEPDLMFCDGKTFALCSACVTAFIIGSVVHVRTRQSRRRIADTSLARSYGIGSLTVPLALATLIACVTLIVIGLKTEDLVLLLAARGDVIKGDTGGELGFWGKVIQLAPLHMGVIWWYFYRLREAESGRNTKRLATVLLGISVVVAVGNAVALADRTALMPIIVGLLPVFLLTKRGGGRLRKPSPWTGFLVIVGLLGAVLGSFTLMSYMRGMDVVMRGPQLIMGYSIASYNRLAGSLKGILTYFYVGNPQDLCGACSTNKYVNMIFPFQTYFNIPPFRTAWLADFVATSSAGLAGGFTFPSAFGGIFRDIGWWSPLYFGAEGIITGIAWRSFRNGKLFGILVYPWCFFTVLFWFGWNVFLNNSLMLLVLLWLGLSLYERYSGATYVREVRTLVDEGVIRDTGADGGR